MKLIFPIVNLVYRTALCVLLLSSLGFMKSFVFHLMTFFFTCYIAGSKPFDGVSENRRQLTNVIFLLLLTYIISIALTELIIDFTEAVGNFAVGFFLIFVLFNLITIAWFLAKKLYMLLRKIIKWTKNKYRKFKMKGTKKLKTS